MTLRTLLKKKKEIIELAGKYGATNVRVFGSVARKAASRHSDVDLLVDFEAPHSLLDRAGLKADLEALLGCQVDVATEKVLRMEIKDRILREAVAL